MTVRKNAVVPVEYAEILLRLVKDLRKTKQYQKNHEKSRYHRDGLVLVEACLAKQIYAVKLSQERAARRAGQ